jgi:hypothetical protein
MKKHIVILLLCLLTFVLVGGVFGTEAEGVRTNDYGWASTGPFDGYINSITPVPGNSDSMYVGADSGGRCRTLAEVHPNYLPFLLKSWGQPAPTATPTQTPTFTPTATPTPTPTQTPTVTPTKPSGIYGRVTYNNTSASGVTLSLQESNDSEVTVATTSTDNDGRYQFLGIPTLSSGHNYYVRFGPNVSHSDYVYLWFGPTISSYSHGASVHGGDFDIANVTLISPDHGATLPFPVTFTWNKRPVPSDTYSWLLFDPSAGVFWQTNNLGYVDSFTIMGPTGPWSDLEYGRVYGWLPKPFNGPDSFGLPYYHRQITFSAGAANTLTEDLTPMKFFGTPNRAELCSPFEKK